MNFTAILAAGIAFMRSLPDIIKFMYSVKSIIDEGMDYWNRREQLAKLSTALKDAHATGDTTGLESFFSGRIAVVTAAESAQLPKQPPGPSVGR